MTVNTIWNGGLPAGTSSTAAGARTDGILFTITSLTGTPTITAIGWYVPVGETTLAGSAYTALLYTTVTGLTGSLVTSNAGSGTFTAGAWNWITLTSPVTLSTGIYYVAAISSPDLIQFVHSYWSTGGPGIGGLVSGPISVPDATTAPGGNQQGNISAANSFPASSTGTAYGIDVQVTTTGGGSSGTVTGAVATAALAAPTGAVSAGAAVTGAVAASALAAPTGTVHAAATVTGVAATASLVAPPGVASGGSGVSVAGVPAAALLTAPTGTVSAAANVHGVTATAVLFAPPGRAGALVLPALDPWLLKGAVVGLNYGGQVIGINQEDYTGNGYGGLVT